MTVATVRISDLGELEELDRGGQAVIYRVPNYPVPNPVLPDVRGRLVLKKYKPSALSGRETAVFHGLARLLTLREDLRNDEIDRSSVWPLAVVVRDEAPSRAVGLLMRELPVTCFFDLRLLTTTKRKVLGIGQFLQSEADLMARGVPVLTERDRLVLLVRLVRFLAVMHRNQIIVGDISGNNVVVRRAEGRTDPYFPMLVDVDTVRVRGEGAAFSQGTTPDWEPPEALRLSKAISQAQTCGDDQARIGRLVAQYNAQNFASDVYKTALLVLRMFHEGSSHSSVRDSATAREKLTALLGPARAYVLWQALDESPERRPSMAALAAALAGGPRA